MSQEVIRRPSIDVTFCHKKNMDYPEYDVLCVFLGCQYVDMILFLRDSFSSDNSIGLCSWNKNRLFNMTIVIYTRLFNITYIFNQRHYLKLNELNKKKKVHYN